VLRDVGQEHDDSTLEAAFFAITHGVPAGEH
jgi:hypothetical protein